MKWAASATVRAGGRRGESWRLVVAVVAGEMMKVPLTRATYVGTQRSIHRSRSAG